MSEDTGKTFDELIKDIRDSIEVIDGHKDIDQHRREKPCDVIDFLEGTICQKRK